MRADGIQQLPPVGLNLDDWKFGPNVRQPIGGTSDLKPHADSGEAEPPVPTVSERMERADLEAHLSKERKHAAHESRTRPASPPLW